MICDMENVVANENNKNNESSRRRSSILSSRCKRLSQHTQMTLEESSLSSADDNSFVDIDVIDYFGYNKEDDMTKLKRELFQFSQMFDSDSDDDSESDDYSISSSSSSSLASLSSSTPSDGSASFHEDALSSSFFDDSSTVGSNSTHQSSVSEFEIYLDSDSEEDENHGSRRRSYLPVIDSIPKAIKRSSAPPSTSSSANAATTVEGDPTSAPAATNAPYGRRKSSLSHSSTKTENQGQRRQRRLTFDSVEVREYNVTVGAHAATSDTCPLQLDWKHTAEKVSSLETYERTKQLQQQYSWRQSWSQKSPSMSHIKSMGQPVTSLNTLQDISASSEHITNKRTHHYQPRRLSLQERRIRIALVQRLSMEEVQLLESETLLNQVQQAMMETRRCHKEVHPAALVKKKKPSNKNHNNHTLSIKTTARTTARNC